MQRYIGHIIQMSLVLLGFRTLLDFITSLFIENVQDPNIVVMEFSLIALVAFQLLNFSKRLKFLWVLSAFQVILIYYFGLGTFGWLVDYLFQSSREHFAYAYLLLFMEIMKTIWLFKKDFTIKQELTEAQSILKE